MTYKYFFTHDLKCFHYICSISSNVIAITQTVIKHIQFLYFRETSRSFKFPDGTTRQYLVVKSGVAIEDNYFLWPLLGELVGKTGMLMQPKSEWSLTWVKYHKCQIVSLSLPPRIIWAEEIRLKLDYTITALKPLHCNISFRLVYTMLFCTISTTVSSRLLCLNTMTLYFNGRIIDWI